MKNLIYGCAIFFATLMVYGCKKDHSNNDLKEIPEIGIDTVGGLGRYEIRQGVGELVIDPKLLYNGDQSDLTYLWRFFNVPGDPSAPVGVIDTTTNKVFKSVINKSPGNYIAELQVKHTNTGLRAFMRYTIRVLAPDAVPYGWLLAHETASGNTAIGFVRTKEIVKDLATDNIRMDIFSEANGSPVTGRPVSFWSSSLIITDKTATRVNSTNYKQLFDFQNLFVGNPPAPKPEGNTGQFLINNGEAWWYNTFASKFIAKVTVDAKGCRPAPFTVNIPGTSEGSFYDELNKRFIRLMTSENPAGTPYGPPTTPPSTTPRFNLYNFSKIFLSNLVQGVSANTNRYGFFRDTDGSKTWLYGFNFSTPDNPDAAVFELSATSGLGTDMNQAKFFDLGTLSAMAVCATDNKVYSFTYGSSIQDVNTGFTAPAGEVITCMKIFKNAGSGFSGSESLNNKILMVATWNATTQKGKLYMLSLSPVNGQVGATPIKIIDGFGKVKDMILKTS